MVFRLAPYKLSKIKKCVIHILKKNILDKEKCTLFCLHMFYLSVKLTNLSMILVKFILKFQKGFIEKIVLTKSHQSISSPI